MAAEAQNKIIYTLTDEAPMLATYSLLPIINRFTKPAGVVVETSDISLSGRIISQFPECLTENQRLPDYLAQLGELVQKPEANVIKLPNISASVPQLNAAIAELRSQGYDLPLYPESPSSAEEQAIKDKYSKCIGSSVNPVLREGNSDRRVALPVKNHAKLHPHRMMKPWNPNSRSDVLNMSDGDFYGSEQTVVMSAADTLTIALVDENGTATTLKTGVPVDLNEVQLGSSHR